MPPARAPFHFVEGLHPWEQQAGESSKAYGAFKQYLDTDPTERSISRMARETQTSETRLHVFSARNKWRMRAAAWDREKERAKRNADLASLEAMRDRHIRLAINLQGLGAGALKPYIEALTTGAPLPGRISIKDAKDLIELGAKMERLNRGEPDSIEEKRLTITAEDRRTRLRALLGDPRIFELTEELVSRLEAPAPGSPTEPDAPIEH